MRSAKYILGRGAFGLCALLLCGQTPQQAEKSREAKQHMAAGRFAEASAIYEQLIREVPGNPGLLLNLGMAHHMAGRDDAAIPPLERAVKAQPNLFPAQMFLGVSYMRTGQPAKAVPAFEKALTLQPDELEGRQMLADALAMLGRHEGAIVQLRKLAAVQPQNPRLWFGIGRAYEALAQKTFEKLEKQAPGSPYFLALAGESRLRAKRYNSAFALLNAASAKTPVPAGVHTALAEIYEASGKPEWAETARQKEPKLNCTTARTLPCLFARQEYEALIRQAKPLATPDAWFWLTKAYNQLAAGAFKPLGGLPPSAELHEVAAEMHRGARRYQESIAAWQEALKINPADSRLKHELAATFYLAQDYENAIALLRRLEKSPEVLFLLGDSLLISNQPLEAVPLLAEAVKLDPKHLPARSALGRALLQLDRHAEAVPHLEAALPIDTSGATHYSLSRAYLEAGRDTDAKRLLARYQELQAAVEPVDIEITAPR